MKWIDKIKTMDSADIARLLCNDFEHTSCCNVCYYYRYSECCDLCEVGIKAFFDSEVLNDTKTN